MKIAFLALLFCCTVHATLIPGPNLAKRTEAADAIVVGKLVRGTTRGSGSEISTDMTLRVDRVLKGDLIPGTEIAARLEGRGFWMIERATEAPAAPLYGIWFLNSTSRPITVISRDGRLGELQLAPALLAEEAPAGKLGDTPAASVANALMASLRWIAEVHGAEITRRDTVVSEYWSKFHSCLSDLYSLEPAATLPVSKQLAGENNIHLRAAGIHGLIAANDSDGVKLAAGHWTELAKYSGVPLIIASLMGYSNAQDPAAVQALGKLATIDPAEPGLRENASYALRAIHTKEALPAFIALLDNNEERVVSNALAGLCLFVRNAPTVTAQSIPSMSWMKTQEPAPYLTPETQPYCSMGGKVSEVERYTGFWKSWWTAHRGEIEGC